MLVATLALVGCSNPFLAGALSGEPAEIVVAPATGQTITRYGYSFVAPVGWTYPKDVSEPGADVVVSDMTDPDGFADNINVVLSERGRVTPRRAEVLGAKALRDADASDVVVRGRVMVAGKVSVHLSATFSRSGVTYRTEQFLLGHEDTFYVVTFSFSPYVSKTDRDDLSHSVLATWTWI